MNDNLTLVKWDKIRTEIETSKDIDVLIGLKDKLRAYQLLAEQSKQSAEVQAKIAIYKARADRKCGEWLRENVKAGNPQLSNNTTIGLQSLGVTRDESSRLQKIASIPDNTFEKILQTAEVETKKITNNMLVSIAKEAEKENRKAKEYKTKELPEGIFQILYADPPWRYDFAETDNRKIENQYPTMDIDDLCSLQIPRMSDDALLLLWATAPKLPEAMRLIESWNFKYITHCIWDKEIIGMGYWFRGQHELLIVATRGNFSPPDVSSRNSSIYREKRQAHSKKPIHFYDWIEQAYPKERKIELFSRVTRSGWESWGNECL